MRLALAALLLAAPLHADTLLVPKDFGAIQAAVDAAANGDTILIKSGTYIESVTLQKRIGLTLRGKGKVTLRAFEFSGTALNIGQCSDVRVEGLTIESADTGVNVNTCSGVALDGLRVRDVADAGVRIGASTRVSVHDLRVDDADDGVVIASSNVVSLLDLDLRDVQNGVLLGSFCGVVSVAESRLSGRGDGTGSGVRADDDAIGMQLRANKLRDFGTGVHVEGNSITVIGNRVANCSVGMVLGETGKVNLIQAVENRVSKIDGIGISMLGQTMLLRGNRVNKAGTGVFVHPNASAALLHDNRINGSQGLGIDLNASATALAGNLIKGSGDADVEDSGSGNLFQRDAPLPDGATLRVPQDFATIQAALNAADDGDTVLISSGSYTGALGLGDASGITLRGKGKVVLRNPAGTALALQDCTDILIQNVRFADAARGLRVTTSASVSVSKCRFDDNTDQALLSVDAVGVFVSDSRFADNSGAVALSDTVRSVVERSRLDGVVDETSGVLLDNVANVSVSGNRLRDHSSGLTGGDRNVSLGRNRLWSCGEAIVVGAEGGLVHDNRVWGGHNGIVTTTDGAGDAQLVGNRVSGADARAFIPGGNRAIVADNVATGSGIHGMQHTSCTQLLVLVNRLVGSAIDGLETQGATQSLYAHNKATNNKGLDLRVTTFDGNVFVDNTVKTTNLEP